MPPPSGELRRRDLSSVIARPDPQHTRACARVVADNDAVELRRGVLKERGAARLERLHAHAQGDGRRMRGTCAPLLTVFAMNTQSFITPDVRDVCHAAPLVAELPLRRRLVTQKASEQAAESCARWQRAREGGALHGDPGLVRAQRAQR
jgi:hypothetical protein